MTSYGLNIQMFNFQMPWRSHLDLISLAKNSTRKNSSIMMDRKIVYEDHKQYRSSHKLTNHIRHTFNSRSHPAKESFPGGQKDNWHLLRVLHGTVPLSGVTDTNFSPSATRSPFSLVRLLISQEKSKLNLPELITNSCRVAFSLISTLKWRKYN